MTTDSSPTRPKDAEPAATLTTSARIVETGRGWLWYLAVGWFAVAVAVVTWDTLYGDFGGHWLSRVYFWATVVFSVVAFALYGWDKRQARRDGRRISEATLHRLAMFGGWPGGILGQQFFRHKTQKISFRLKAGAILFVHLLIVLYVLRTLVDRLI